MTNFDPVFPSRIQFAWVIDSKAVLALAAEKAGTWHRWSADLSG